MDREQIKFKIPSLFFDINTFFGNKLKNPRGKHCHNAVEIIYVKKGNVVWFVNDDAIQLKEGETLIINSNVIHSGVEMLDSNSVITYIHVDIAKYIKSSLSKQIKNINEFVTKYLTRQYYVSGQDKELSIVCENIERESIQQKPGFELYIKAYIYQIVAFMNRKGLLTNVNELRGMDLLRIEPVIDYIENNFQSRLYIEELSDIIHYSKYQLCRCFKKITGGTVVDYINFVRLSYAVEMLGTTDMTVSDIALECGFASTQYFNETFKKYKGCTPGAFRHMWNS